MRLLSPQTTYVMTHPAAFALQVIKAFRANQGMLLAGAVAYYVLLSIIPMLILMVIVLSHVIGQAELIDTLRRALEWLAPGQSGALARELTAFLAHKDVLGWVLLATMLFFSSQAFTVIESAISVIFLHRVTKRRRHALVSYVLIPLGYISVIGAALLVGTMVLAGVVAIGEQSLVIMGHVWSLGGPSRFLIYLAGVATEILLISSIYYFMPVSRLSARQALIGGVVGRDRPPPCRCRS
jgi:membrane protein